MEAFENFERDLDDIRHALVCVYVHKFLHDKRKLKDYIPYESEYMDAEMDLESCVYGLQYISDAVWSHYSDYYQVETMYFSHSDIMEYYRLCRVYGKKFGVNLVDNPYMRAAASYVRSQLNQSCYACEYILQTNINHEWASGIVFRMWPEFEWHFELLTLLIDIFGFYTEQLEKLKMELETVKINQPKEAA